MLLHWPRALHSFPLQLLSSYPFLVALFALPFLPLLFPLLALSLCFIYETQHLAEEEQRLLHFGCPAEEDAWTARLLLLMFYYPQQIKIASFCPAQCKSCLVMPTSGWGSV